MHSLIYKNKNSHDHPIHCCTWSRKSKSEREPARDIIATGSIDCLVKVWEWKNNSLNLIHTLKGHDMSIVSVAISPDCYALASNSLDSKLIIWDLESGQQAKVIETGPTDVWTLAFSPDSQHVAAGSHTGKIFVYNIGTGNLDGILDTRGKFVMSVCWSPDGQHIVSSSVDGKVYIFDAFQCKLSHTFEAHSCPVRSVSFSMDSQLLLTASDDGTLKIFKVATGSLQGTLTAGTDSCWVLNGHFSADGKKVVASTSDGHVKLFALKGLKPLHVFKDHSDAVWGVQFNKEGNRLVSASKDRSINVYQCPA